MLNVLDMDYKKAQRKRAVNGEKVISFTVYPTKKNKRIYESIVEETIVTFKDDEYVIKLLNEKSKGKKYYKQVTAIHKFYVDLINKQQPKIHNGSITFHNYMQMVFEHTGYTFEVLDQFSARQFENLGNDNRLALLQKGLGRFKAEMELVDNNKKARIRRMVGNDTDFQFRYGHNIKAIDVEIDTSNLATKIAGTGDPELGITASYTSPNIAIFGEIDAPPVNDERFKSEETLLTELKARIIDEPEVSITIDFVDLRAAGYPYAIPNEGDRIWLIYEPMDDLLLETRIIEINETFNNEGDIIKTEVTLSNHRKSFAGTLFDNVQKQLNDIVTEDGLVRYSALDEAVRIATESLQSAQTELEFINGIIAREKTDPNRLVLLNSKGLGISKDGGATFDEAITADGFVLSAGAIGRLNANNIQIGPETFYVGDSNFDPEKEYIIDGDEARGIEDLVFVDILYGTQLTIGDVKVGNVYKLTFEAVDFSGTGISLGIGSDTNVDQGYNLYYSDTIEMGKNEIIFEITEAPTETPTNSIVLKIGNYEGANPNGFLMWDVSLRQIDQVMEIPFDEWIGYEISTNVTEHIEFADGRIREDLRLASPLPTSLRLDENGITAFTSSPSRYARLDHRGLYIKGGAIQIDGGLPDSQIGNADKWNVQGTFINEFGIYTGYISANQVEVGFNNIGQRVKITSAGLTTYSGGLRTSFLDGLGHGFYHEGNFIGNIGTNNWIGDTNYRGLTFDLENRADYMSWGYQKTPTAQTYTTMLAWHKTNLKAAKGFTFYDVVTFNHGIKFSSRGRVISYTNAVKWAVNTNNVHITQYDDGEVHINTGSLAATHVFFPDGTKQGGSIVIDDKRYGMSPTDSPQILIEYIEFDIDLSETGTKVYLDETYVKAVDNFAVFLNNGQVVDKGTNYFIATGTGKADAHIVGRRVDYQDAFWGRPCSSDDKPTCTKPTTLAAHNWYKEERRTEQEESQSGQTMKVLQRSAIVDEI